MRFIHFNCSDRPCDDQMAQLTRANAYRKLISHLDSFLQLTKLTGIFFCEKHRRLDVSVLGEAPGQSQKIRCSDVCVDHRRWVRARAHRQERAVGFDRSWRSCGRCRRFPRRCDDSYRQSISYPSFRDPRPSLHDRRSSHSSSGVGQSYHLHGPRFLHQTTN